MELKFYSRDQSEINERIKKYKREETEKARKIKEQEKFTARFLVIALIAGLAIVSQISAYFYPLLIAAIAALIWMETINKN